MARALLVIDVINPLRFDGGKRLLAHALPAARAIARLSGRFRARGWPVVYVNDNFLQWTADFKDLFNNCTRANARGAPLARLVPPVAGDYYILKPEQSGFHSTALHILLTQLEVDHLVLTGIAGDGCVMATAMDANMRKYRLTVPSDCIACLTPARKKAALLLLREALRADVRSSVHFR